MAFPILRRPASLLLTGLLACLAAGVQADEPVPPATAGTSGVTEAKLVSEFTPFLGSEEASRSVVTGLRQSTAFTLTNPDDQMVTTIDPPTDAMGYGNVRISLRLAEAQLSGLGITQPTAEQLSAMLLGGDINGIPVDGVLAMRTEGMGWGQIAQHYGTTVGQLMGNGAVKLGHPATVAPASTTGTAKAASPAKTNGYIPSGQGKNAGIVTGAGASLNAGGSGGGKGHVAKASGQGMVTAGGTGVSAAGVSKASGAGKAGAPGQAKKD